MHTVENIGQDQMWVVPGATHPRPNTQVDVRLTHSCTARPSGSERPPSLSSLLTYTLTCPRSSETVGIGWTLIGLLFTAGFPFGFIWSDWVLFSSLVCWGPQDPSRSPGKLRHCLDGLYLCVSEVDCSPVSPVYIADSLALASFSLGWCAPLHPL